VSDKADAISADSAIRTAARELAVGDPLGALNHLGPRDDAPGLALRGIAMAQLGDLSRARMLIRRAARAFGPSNVVARARCAVAEAEIALAARDLGWPGTVLSVARKVLQANGDRTNAAYAGQLEARRLLLVGQVEAAEQALAEVDPATFPPAPRAMHELVVAGVAMRRLDTRSARAALNRAGDAAHRARSPALAAEVESAIRLLDTPAARRVGRGEERLLQLEDVEALLASDAVVVDACRHAVRTGKRVVSLATRRVLFALARALGEAWPADVARDALAARAFGSRYIDESHRARLRVELARLRSLLAGMVGIGATARGFALRADGDREVVVLAWPVEDDHAALLAFLADGEPWSSSALALALGTSQRTVQRALESLARAGKVQWFGEGRARRWISPSVPGFTTTLLLPGPLI
jgi:hypothetical protein